MTNHLSRRHPSRRETLLAAAAASVLATAGRAAAAEALTFDEMYASEGVFGLTFSPKLKSLAGKPVAMRGFMAPPLQAEADFFVLTEIPMSICPFCSSDADWPDNIVVVRLDSARTFEQANALIEVTGRLDVGSWTDPKTGFVSLVRIVGADFGRA